MYSCIRTSVLSIFYLLLTIFFPHQLFSQKIALVGDKVLIENTDTSPRILGIADDGDFDPNNIPPSMRFWMEYLNQRTEAINEFQPKLTRANGKEISPLLGETKWGQEEPFNKRCPKIGGYNCVSGCSAIAMAMIMRYHQYPQRGNGTKSYTTKTKNLEINYNFSQVPFDWDNMLDSYSVGQSESDRSASLGNNMGASIVYCSMHPSGDFGGITIRVDTIINVSKKTLSGKIQMLLFDQDNKFLGTVGTSVTFNNLKENYGMNYIDLRVSLPNDIEDGKYTVRLGLKIDNADKWQRVSRFNYDSGKLISAQSIELEKKGQIVYCGEYSCNVQYTDSQAKAVANLVYSCGVSVEMDYTLNESGALVNEQFESFSRYFSYDKNTFVANSENMSSDFCNDIIIQELEAGRPVYIGGVNEKGEGHSFVIDGLTFYDDSTPMYHINWGWYGIANGYFLLSSFNPNEVGTGASSGSNFSHKFYVIGNIKPEDNIDEGPAVFYSKVTANKGTFNAGNEISVTVQSLTNASPYFFSGNASVFLTDSNGKETNLGDILEIKDLGPMYYYRDPITKKFKIPSDIHADNYTVSVRACSDDNKNVYGKAMSDFCAKIRITNPNGIDDIVCDEAKPADTYDIYGRKISHPNQKGIYISGGKKIIK